MAKKLRKSYNVFVGQNLWQGGCNIYRGDVLMAYVAYGSLRGVVHMGMGNDKEEALADLSLRMLGHDEESFRLKPVNS